MSPEIIIPGPLSTESMSGHERRLTVGEGIYRFVLRRPPEDDVYPDYEFGDTPYTHPPDESHTDKDPDYSI